MRGMVNKNTMLAVAGSIFMSACERSDPPPQLLERAIAGNSTSLCSSETGKRLMKDVSEKLSSNVTERLRAKFPPGSSSKDIRKYLVSQGFVSIPCEGDPSVIRYKYDSTSTMAIVAWLPSDHGMVWIKSFVSHEGL